MLRQTSFWVGIGTSFVVLVIVGLVALNWSGMRVTTTADSGTATPVVATAIVPTATVLVQEQPLPTMATSADCRVETANWITRMNAVLVMMINTDDANPVATRQAFRAAQTMFSEFTVPVCADEQVIAIDKSIRESLPLYISWTDELINNNAQRAQEYENQGDRLFVLSDYYRYLRENSYTDEGIQLHIDLVNAQADVTTTRSNTTSSSTYDACVAEVDDFRTAVDGYYETGQNHIKTLEAYVNQQPVANLDPYVIDVAYQTFDKVTAPTCIDEPTEILYNLRLMFNTLKPAFVEAKVELASGNPDAASYALVRGWIDELRRFDRDLAALYASVPKSLAALPGAAGADSTDSTANASQVDESLDDLPLDQYALQLADFPAGMTAEPSKFLTAEEVAASWIEYDPAMILENFNKYGRKDTYIVGFVRSSELPVENVGADYISVAITHTPSSTNSSGLVSFIRSVSSDYDSVDLLLQGADESYLLTKQQKCGEATNVYTCKIVTIFTRLDNVVVQVVAVSYVSDVIDIDRICEYAQRMLNRIDQ